MMARGREGRDRERRGRKGGKKETLEVQHYTGELADTRNYNWNLLIWKNLN